MTLHVQFLTMISMSVGGFYLGIARDTFRRFSPYWKHRPFLLYFLEICFWMTQTFLLYYILYRVNAGELRVYVFIACLLGFSIYQVIAATIYKKLLDQIIRVLMMVYGFFKAVIHMLIIRPVQWIFYMILTILQFISLLLFFMLKLIFTPIGWIMKLGFSLLPKRIQKNIRKLNQFYSIIKNTSMKWLKYMLFKER